MAEETKVKKLNTKISPDIAEEEVDKWLDYKHVSESKRETNKAQIEVITNAIADGYLTLNEDHSFTQHLNFPTEGDAPVTELQFKPRLRVKQIHSHLKGVKADDIDARLAAYVGALTSQPNAVIKGLDTEDYSIAQAIALFFL